MMGLRNLLQIRREEISMQLACERLELVPVAWNFQGGRCVEREPIFENLPQRWFGNCWHFFSLSFFAMSNCEGRSIEDETEKKKNDRSNSCAFEFHIAANGIGSTEILRFMMMLGTALNNEENWMRCPAFGTRFQGWNMCRQMSATWHCAWFLLYPCRTYRWFLLLFKNC